MVSARSWSAADGALRLALLAAVLAVLAGFLGMHIFSGSQVVRASAEHSAIVAPAVIPGHSTASHAVSGHTTAGHSGTGHPGAATGHETPAPPSCVGGGGCGEQHTAHVSCTPAPSGASVGAPPPGTTLLAVQPRSAPLAAPATAYSYLPATPTPSELSISRT